MINIPSVSQTSVAEHLGIGRGVVQRWAKLRKPVPVHRLLEIAEYLEGVSVELMREAKRLRNEHAWRDGCEFKHDPWPTNPLRDTMNPDELDPYDGQSSVPMLLRVSQAVRPESQPYRGDEHRRELFGKREDNISRLKEMEW